ncbi:MAG TPA: SH3 domain-containing protein, partial [Propionibacteriaceae bacterium]|nr:SH3 domain-containing protein [Propionibacteriaceae bacterium]
MIRVVRGARAAGGAAALALGLTGMGLVVGPAAVADSVMTATTTVNVRAGASTGTAVVGVLPAGTSVTATGPSTNGWTKITFNGRAAYVSTTYLKSATSTTTTTLTSVSSMSATTLEAVNVRTGPDIASSVWTVLPKGQTITVTGVTQNGYHQLTDGHWVSSAWITVAATLAIPVATPTPSPTAAPTTAAPTTSPTTAAPTKAPTTTTPVVLPPVTGQVRATTALMIRTTSGSDFVNLGDV